MNISTTDHQCQLTYPGTGFFCVSCGPVILSGSEFHFLQCTYVIDVYVDVRLTLRLYRLSHAEAVRDVKSFWGQWWHAYDASFRLSSEAAVRPLTLSVSVIVVSPSIRCPVVRCNGICCPSGRWSLVVCRWYQRRVYIRRRVSSSLAARLPLIRTPRLSRGVTSCLTVLYDTVCAIASRNVVLYFGACILQGWPIIYSAWRPGAPLERFVEYSSNAEIASFRQDAVVGNLVLTDEIGYWWLTLLPLLRLPNHPNLLFASSVKDVLLQSCL